MSAGSCEIGRVKFPAACGGAVHCQNQAYKKNNAAQDTYAKGKPSLDTKTFSAKPRSKIYASIPKKISIIIHKRT